MGKKSLKPILTSGLFILLSFCSVNFSQARDIEVLTQGLEKTFNTRNKSALFNLFSEKIAKDAYISTSIKQNNEPEECETCSA